MERVACFHFEGRLNDFFPDEEKGKPKKYLFKGKPSIKDAIEAMGIPHVEIGQININGQVGTPNDSLLDGDQVYLFPCEELFPESGYRFLADSHLGKLVKELRILGFDTYYQKETNEKQIIAQAIEENRILLSRSINLLKYKALIYGYWIRSEVPLEQINELVIRFDLKKFFQPFTRCLDCNSPIVSVAKTEVQAQIPNITNQVFDEFYQCTGCNKIFWKGSHYDRMKKFIEQVE